MFNGSRAKPVVRFQAQGLLEILAGAADHAVGVVTWRRGRALGPANRFFVTAGRKQVRAHIVGLPKSGSTSLARLHSAIASWGLRWK